MSIEAVPALFATAQRLTDFAPTRSATESPKTVPPPSSNVADVLKNMPQARQLQVDASFGQANLIIYRILDKQTGDLILQVPPEQLLQIARSIQESQAEPVRPNLDVRS